MPDDTKIPYGFCHCGCGEKTTINKKTNRRTGQVRGEPNDFIPQHHKRISYADWLARRTPKVRYIADPSTGCWNWQGKLHDGYGRIQVDGKRSPAHVFYYEQKYGPIPDGLEADHTCRNRQCVNPDHIEAVTRAVNVQRGVKAKLTKDEVSRMRALGKFASYAEVGRTFGVSESQAIRILKGEEWRNIA